MTPEERAQQGPQQVPIMSEADRIVQFEATAAQMAQDSFVNLINWMKEWDQLSQKNGPIEQFIQRVKSLASVAKDEFGFKMPEQMLAAKLLVGCTEINARQLGAITAQVDLEFKNNVQEGIYHKDWVATVEKAIRKFTTTVKAIGSKAHSSEVFLHKRLNTSIASDVEDQNLIMYDLCEELEEDMSIFDLRRHVCQECYRAVASEEALSEHMNSCHPKSKKSLRMKSAKNKAIPEGRPRVKNTFSKVNYQEVAQEQDLQLYLDPHERFNDQELFDYDSDPGTYTTYVTFSNPTSVFSVKIASEAADYAILDSGCERSVCGIQWADEYFKTLDEEDKAQLEILPSTAKFKFGDGKLHLSRCLVKTPVYIAGLRKIMVFDVVDLKLPLLISLKVMQKLKIRIQYDDEDQETAEIGGRIVNLLNSQGHHWISLSKKVGVQGNKDQE